MTGEFCIVLSSSKTYVPGDTVSGKVVYLADELENTEGIDIAFSGSMSCSWNEYCATAKRDNRTTHTGFEQIFLLKKNLLSQGGGTAVDLQPGWNYYPFAFTLPYDIPSSFNGTHGNIKYELTATMKRLNRSNDTTNLTVCVKDYLDLNNFPDIGIPLTCKMNKSVFSGRNYTGKVKVTFEISKRGALPGELVPTTLTVHNKTNFTVIECNIHLVGVVKYQTNDRKHYIYDNFYKAFVDVMKTVESSQKRSVAAAIKIPKQYLRATNFSSSKYRIISLHYYFEVELKLPYWTNDMQNQFPIIIGTPPVSDRTSAEPPTVRLVPSISRESSQDSGPHETNISNRQQYSQRPTQILLANQDPNMGSTYSLLSLPPRYENSHTPPPTYDEAMFFK